jgi:3-dehydroquinate dehydratase type I
VKLVVTIHERTLEAAIEAIRALHAPHDMVELRVDAFGGGEFDVAEAKAATDKPLIVTNRGGDPHWDDNADFVDVEWHPGVRIADRQRCVLSHHDFESTPDLVALSREMRALGCAHTKIAVTPRNFDDNARVLETVAPGMTLIGMGARGLYSRILAPFFGSELMFVGSAAPGQLTLERALAIYGDDQPRKPERIFAVVGNPAAHSGSPAIHNRLFREAGVAAAYSIFDTDDFLDIAVPFKRRERFAPSGLSITAPFKEEALTFAEHVGAEIRDNAREAGAVNTLVRIGDRIVADNTDVDGFAALIARSNARDAAVVGAGGTARAALVALRRAGIETRVFNRTADKLGAEPLEKLASWRGDLLINTLPASAQHEIARWLAPHPGSAESSGDSGAKRRVREAPHVITAAYSGGSNELLEAQAVRQNALFIEACR